MRARWLLYNATRPLYVAHSRTRLGGAKAKVGTAMYYAQEALLTARALGVLVMAPYIWVRAKAALWLFGPSIWAFDLISAVLASYQCARMATAAEQKKILRIGYAPVERAWGQEEAADRCEGLTRLSPTLLTATGATGANMLVYQVPESKGGGLVLHGCVFLHEAQLQELAGLGPVRAVICPSVRGVARAVVFAERLGAELYMPRMMAVAADSQLREWGKKLRPRIAEESPLEGRFGVAVHVPSGTRGHGKDGRGYPAENFYEFPDGAGGCVLGCGTLLSDRDAAWDVLPLHESLMGHVGVPTRVLKEGVSKPDAFQAFLQRMAAKRPQALVPAVGGTVAAEAEAVIRASAEKVREWNMGRV